MNSYGLADHSPPPSDLDAEASVLGAVMLAEKWLDSYEVGGLVPDDFYRPRNQLIFRAIKSLRSTNDPIDHVTVAARLDRVGEIENVGRDYVTSLVHHIANIGNTKAYATVIKENSLLRKLLQAGWEIERLVHEREGEPLELVERSLALVGEIGLPVGERAYGPDDLMDLAVAHFSNERPTEVFPLSLPALNEATNGGLRRGQVMADLLNDRAAAKCKKCGDTIQSQHVHDYRTCSCGAVSIDGGSHYLRMAGNPEDYTFIPATNQPQEAGE